MSGFIVTKLDASIYDWCTNYDCPFFQGFHGGKVINGKDPDRIATTVECNIKPMLGMASKGAVVKSCPRGKIFDIFVHRTIELERLKGQGALPQELFTELEDCRRVLSEYGTDEEKQRVIDALKEQA